MSTSAVSDRKPVEALAVGFAGERLLVHLSDGRTIGVDLNCVPAFKWLLKATPGERLNWEIEPGGFAVYWPLLDDGIEVVHLLDPLSMID